MVRAVVEFKSKGGELTPPSNKSVRVTKKISSLEALFSSLTCTPDVNASLTFHLISGNGAGDNDLFSMDTSGNLRTLVIS